MGTKFVRLLLLLALILGGMQVVRWASTTYRDDEAHAYAAGAAEGTMRRLTVVGPDEQPEVNRPDTANVGQRSASVATRSDDQTAVAWIPGEGRCNMAVLSPAPSGDGWTRLFLDRADHVGESGCTGNEAFAAFDRQLPS